MEDGLDAGQLQVSGNQRAPELSLVHIIDKLRPMQVQGLSRVKQVIDHENIADALRVEFVDKVRADEAGPSGNDVHAFSLCEQLLDFGHCARQQARLGASLRW